MSMEHNFRVTRTRIVPVVTYRQETEVIYEGDDWLDAEDAHHAAVMDRTEDGRITFEGRHPSHRIEDTACVKCAAPDNGCFAIHLPCGFDTGSKAIVTVKEEERARREMTASRADEALRFDVPRAKT